MAKLTLERARTLVAEHVREPHLLVHALAVSAAMGRMAAHFGQDEAYWQAVGYLHDVDFERYPDAHLAHVRELLEPEGIDEEVIRAVEAHGWGICSDVEPLSLMEKSLFTVDELTGIVQATALMRPAGIADLGVSSVMKKFKDKRFAAKCDREVIRKGCAMLGMEVSEVAGLCIEGMRGFMEELGIGPKEQ